MTEVQFAKQFLTTLDSKNTKYQPDHVFDPQTFQTRTPYTLPKLSHPPYPLPPKPSTSTGPAPGSLPSTSESLPATINIILKSTRNPTFTLTILSTPLSTQILSLKPHIQSLLPSTPSDKIKILYNKKPIPSTKPSVSDVLDPSTPPSENVEFTVMILGGAPDPSPATQTIDLKAPTPASTSTSEEEKPQPTSQADATTSTRNPSDPVQPGEISGEAVLATPEFWDDLQGFLEQRLKDTDQAKRVRGIFEEAVRK